MNRSIWRRKHSALWSMSSRVSILRISVLPDGSPIMVVPPPISAIGLLPAIWSRFMSVSAMK